MIEPNRDRHASLPNRFGNAIANVPSRPAPAWMFYALAGAAVWHGLLGLLLVLAPGWFAIDGASPAVVRLVGALVLAWGLGAGAAAADAYRHWPVAFAGAIGLLGAACVLGAAAIAGTVAEGAGLAWSLVCVAWSLPCIGVLRAAWRDGDELPCIRRFYPFMKESILQTAMTHRGERMLDLSNDRPLLLVFLRHSGCTFCREALTALGADRSRIERLGTRIVLVHMSDPDVAEANARQHGLDGIDLVASNDQALYWAFGLRRGRFYQLFGPKVWWRGFVAGVLRRVGIGGLDGDGYQMPGVFLFSRGRVVRAYVHRSAADCPDYVALAMPMPATVSDTPEPADRP